MKFRIALVVLAVVAVALCGAESPIAPRGHVPLDDVERTATAFKTLTIAMAEAMDSGDEEAIRAIFTDNIVHDDGLAGVLIVGIERLVSMFDVNPWPQVERRVTDWFIGFDDSLAVLEYRNISYRRVRFSGDDVAMMPFLLRTDEDRISYWTLFHGLDLLEKIQPNTSDISSERLDEMRSLISSYASAWSSGNPDNVAELYAANAIRKDMIFRDYQEGRDSIRSFSELFFAWYPGAQWELIQAFGDGLGGLRRWGKPPVTGGIFRIEVADLEGQPCDVLIAVLLRTCEGKVIHETLYYEPDSLIRCGWAR